MPLLLPAATLIAGGASSAGQVAGSILTNRTNKKLSREARAYDFKMWNLQNEYNTPKAQMERYKEAGLNPNLIYGNGSVSGNASPVPRSPVTTVENPLKGLDLVNTVMSAISAYNDIRVKDQTISNMKTQEEFTKTKMATETQNAILKRYLGEESLRKTKGLEFKNEILKNQALFAPQLSQANLENAYATLKLRRQQAQLNPQKFELNKIDMALKALQLEMDSKLKPYGLTQKDNYFMRLPALLYDAIKNLKFDSDMKDYKKQGSTW